MTIKSVTFLGNPLQASVKDHRSKRFTVTIPKEIRPLMKYQQKYFLIMQGRHYLVTCNRKSLATVSASAKDNRYLRNGDIPYGKPTLMELHTQPLCDR